MLWQILRGHRSTFPLLSACRFFDTSVSALFWLQAFAFEGQDLTFTVNVLLTCDAGPVCN